jgi:hypothetical protein
MRKSLSMFLLMAGMAAAQTLTIYSANSQSVAQPTKTSFGVSTFNGVYYANQWCATPGTLDDTCFSKAITDIAANGPTGSAGHRYGVIRVPPGKYLFANTVTIPAGINIGIEGEYGTSLWGTIIQSTVNNQVLFRVTSDSTDMRNLTFFNGANSGVVGIQIGTTSIPVFDSHIVWNWFSGVNVAIHLVNGTGYDLSHNTFDAGTVYGIYSSQPSGDIEAAYIVASDLRTYGQLYGIYLAGNPANLGLYENNSFSGLFSASTGAGASVLLQSVQNSMISGVFTDSNNDDIDVINSTGIVIGKIAAHNTGRETLNIQNSTNVNTSGGTITNTAIMQTAGAVPAISVTGSARTRITGFTSTTGTGGVGNASYGLLVDSGSTNTAVYGNSFNSQVTGAYSIADATTNIDIQGIRVAASVFPGTGMQHARGPACTTAVAPFSTCASTAIVWTVPFANTSYTASCTLQNTTGVPVITGFTQTASNITVSIANLTAVAATGTLNCVAMHD